MDILIVSNFATIDEEKGNCRFHDLARQLSSYAEVEIILSSFYHAGKAQRGKESGIYDGVRKTFIHEPGYKRNVSFKRIISHIIWGNRVFQYLKTRKKPDVIYCAVPSLTASKKIARYCEEQGIRFLVDIQDLWPEAFEMILPVPFLFQPMRKQADYIYSRADTIIAVSDTYAKRAAKVNHKNVKQLVVYLGSYYEEDDILPSHSHAGVSLAYVGTIGASYDIKTMLYAVEICVKRYKAEISCCIMGDGPALEGMKKLAKKLEVSVEFTGRLPYNQMMEKLVSSDIAVNPIRHRAAQSIINKVGDYAIAALPVISSQECKEYRQLIKERHIGLNCRCADPEDMAKKIMILYNDENMRKIMGQNNRVLAKERFNRKHSYKAIVEEIMKGDAQYEDRM